MYRNIIITIVLFACCWSTQAQWSSSGNGIHYTITELSNIDSVNVQKLADGKFVIGENITILQGDTLLLENSVTCINMADNIDITIQGTLLTENRTDSLLLSGDLMSNKFFSIHFDNATATTLSNLIIENCYRVLISTTNMEFDKCEFRNFSDACINYMNCNPIIQHCYFHDNQKAAIASPANTYGSPKIINNILYNNDLSNGNFPQINIGPATEDTLYIIDNTIEGLASNMSGGIGIMNIYPSNIVTKMFIANNTIKNNRYGFTQYGKNISSIIINNYFIDNNLETTPNNGGSGISIYGSDSSMRAYLRGNVITGNLWGITAINHHAIDMGTLNDYGNNSIYGNGNSGVKYDLYNNSADNIYAIGNYWGSNDSLEIENVIVHQPDNANLGKVFYSPFLQAQPQAITAKTEEDNFVKIYPNPVQNQTIHIYNNSGEKININLYSVLGQKYKQIQSNNEHIVIDVTNLPKGIYFLQYTHKHGQSVTKISIQ